jgi:acyl carrier protein
MKTKITAIIFAALQELNQELNRAALAQPTGETRLFGAKSPLDSMALVSLIADLEGRIGAEFGRNITLADERAMSYVCSPFRTVDSLASHIELLLAEAPGA